MKTRRLMTVIFLLMAPMSPLPALPVPLGRVDIGLESFEDYQEGQAYLSTNEAGTELEILIGYRGFGLDTVTWTFSGDDLSALRSAALQSAWWRSRLLEMTVNQTVLKEISQIAPDLLYEHRARSYPFESTENMLRFVRQGKDYALLLSETSPGADTRRSGEKILPVFTLHFPAESLPQLRDMLSEESMTAVLALFAEKKAEIDAILNDGPPQS